MNEQINVTRSSMPSYEEYCEEIKKLWESHWLTNMGVEHRLLQSKLEEYLNCPHVVLYTNGHLALEGAIAAMRFPKGSEVITTPFTFASTTHAIVRNGLVPVFGDITETDYTLDPDRIEELITERTVAIVPVHVYGNICGVEKIERIAKKHGLKVIYDAAHAFGVKYKGESVARFGDAAMFSFHATKVFNTIEGGAVCVRDESLLDSLNAGKNFGIKDGQVVLPGGNAKMNEFQAAMGVCNLRHLAGEIEKRKKVVERYREKLGGIPGITLCKQQEEVTPNYAYFPVIFNGYRASRDEVFDALQEKGITARKYFYPLTTSFECYNTSDESIKAKTPVAAFVADHVLTLPLYAGLSDEIIDLICETILSI